MAQWLEVVIAILIPLGGAVIVNAITEPPGDWYKSLNKPSWTPPNWVFPVMWTTLYVLMGIASWLVWRQGGFHANWLPLGLYFTQLLFNWSWTPIFFGMHRIEWALAEILVLWLLIAATTVAFWGVSKLAAGLLVPYICWVSVATALSYYIYAHNPVVPAPAQGDSSGLSQPLRSTAQ